MRKSDSWGKTYVYGGEISCAEEVIDNSQVSVHVELINKGNIRILRNQEEEGVGGLTMLMFY